ncbi:hemagglutinin repeat-containing protein [Edwardsiella ictaluri]|uniref:Hemagglutinin repeat-containing protein n=1 Tax=Edwardsiella ictaluri TaxID=67780 RepID=A0ABY8GI70_EDWIC|nr:hemagglutinin repeat-containing protein [Edwardsiella ictaluri]WFN97050.1 hemagglutinin repeat-containing protein [Edwardsiella ictaluri]
MSPPGGALTVLAGRDIRLTTGDAITDLVEHSKQRSRGLLSSSSLETHDEAHDLRALSSTLSGASVRIVSGGNTRVTGSNVVAEKDVRISAAKNVTVEAATDRSNVYHRTETKISGVFGSGSGIGISVGSQSSESTRQRTETTQSDTRSTVGTPGGNVIIRGGNQATLSAADIIAGRIADGTSRTSGHIDITGSNIAIIPGRDTVTDSVMHERKFSGITVSVKAPFENTVRNIRDALRGRDKNGSAIVDKVKSLGAEGVALALDGPGQAVAVSVGRSKSSAESHYQGEFNHGSHLAAAGNIQMTATGKTGGQRQRKYSDRRKPGERGRGDDAGGEA